MLNVKGLAIQALEFGVGEFHNLINVLVNYISLIHFPFIWRIFISKIKFFEYLSRRLRYKNLAWLLDDREAEMKQSLINSSLDEAERDFLIIFYRFIFW